MKRILFFDTTLRDGEQAPGASMLPEEKLQVAKGLDLLGVDIIEAGFAAASEGERVAIDLISKSIKNATVCCLARSVKEDIDLAAQALRNAKKPRIHVFTPTSKTLIHSQLKKTEEYVLEKIADSVRQATHLCQDVEWSPMDATRTEYSYLVETIKTAILCGANTINIPDTTGYLTPNEFYELVHKLCSIFPDVCFSVHCHNDLGLATANSLAGILAGARQVECTINGIGERAGNAALEEVAMAMKIRPDIFNFNNNIKTKHLSQLSELVARVSGFPIQKNKAIVGENAFLHESGIHQDGMIKAANTYEIISPKMVGVAQSRLFLGKHSGKAALKKKLEDLDIKASPETVDKIFVLFKELADEKKEVTNLDIIEIATKVGVL